MTVWQLCLCVGLILLITEIFVPFTFFLSMSIGAFITAIVAVWITSTTVLAITFTVMSILSLLIFRPFLAKYQKTSKEDETGIDGKYIGKLAKVLKRIDKNSGAISIIDEIEITNGGDNTLEIIAKDFNEESVYGNSICEVRLQRI